MTQEQEQVQHKGKPARVGLILLGVVGCLLVACLIFVTPLLLLFGVGFNMLSNSSSTSSSGQERYQNVQKFIDGLDYKSAGVILEEEKSNSSSINPIQFTATFQNDGAYETLKNRILELAANCYDVNPEKIQCEEGNLSIYLFVQEESQVRLLVIDPSRGE